MKAFIAIGAALFLSACGGVNDAKSVDGKILCSTSGEEAYLVRHHVGANNRLTRVPEADEVCAKERNFDADH